MGMWHVTQKVILLLGLFLKGITQGGTSWGGWGGWGKLMLLAGSYLVWEGGVDGDWHRVITGAGVSYFLK